MKTGVQILIILCGLCGCRPSGNKSAMPQAANNKKITAPAAGDSTGQQNKSPDTVVTENVLDRYSGTKQLVHAIDSILMAERNLWYAQMLCLRTICMVTPEDLYWRHAKLQPQTEPVAGKGGPVMSWFFEANHLYSFMYTEGLPSMVNFTFYKKQLIAVTERCVTAPSSRCGGTSHRTQYFYRGRQVYSVRGLRDNGKLTEDTHWMLRDDDCWCLPRTNEAAVVLRILDKCMKASPTLQRYFNHTNQ